MSYTYNTKGGLNEALTNTCEAARAADDGSLGCGDDRLNPFDERPDDCHARPMPWHASQATSPNGNHEPQQAHGRELKGFSSPGVLSF
jgi:hypothetical protein